MKKVSILGATGYVGTELVRLLHNHPNVEITQLSSHSYSEKLYSEVYPHTYEVIDLKCIEDNPNLIDADILFIALPHGFASKIVTPELLEKTKVIDAGADFRISYEAYKEWYKVEHFGQQLLDEAAYGLVEWNKEKIRNARLVANPGCYVTCSLLSLIPLIKEGLVDENTIIIDGKSGVTGAGRALALGTHYTECNEGMKAYGVASHRHTPEIEEGVKLFANQGVTLTFTPHLVPMNRGILTTIYANLNDGVTEQNIRDAYEKYYRDEPFVRIKKDGEIAQTQWVKGSNYCDISFVLDKRTNRLVVVSAIDNMMKGASGQAIHNMNIMMGFEETAGINFLPIFPV
ncbi:MAG: N-acetyl-gamma-glutamyl-phosphate reductase [Epulopiscium sp. Nele67-Bin005]|nr:MAG: N-acetyl-gamma-glutamyl-phosphate reductase [Epulopiscium sp. Nele67-Bin005]